MNARNLLVATIGKLPSQLPDSAGKILGALAAWTPSDVSGGVLMFALDLARNTAPSQDRRGWCGQILGTMNLVADEADQKGWGDEMEAWATEPPSNSRAVALWRTWANEAERLPEKRAFAAELRSEIEAMLGRAPTATR